MTWPNYLLLFFVGLPGALFFGYAIGIQFQRESLPKWLRDVCEAVAVMTLVIADFPANWTVLSLYFWEKPKPGEWTFSTRLERLWFDAGWRGKLARPIARLLNRIAPSGHPHIKAAAQTT